MKQVANTKVVDQVQNHARGNIAPVSGTIAPTPRKAGDFNANLTMIKAVPTAGANRKGPA